MKFLAIAAVFTIWAACSSADKDVSNFIVNGDDADIREFPYMAKVWNVNWAACGGAILTPRSVLTAAHCLVMRVSRPVLVSVVVGTSHRRGEGGTRHTALRIFMHPDYVPGPNVYDIAVIRTATPIRFTPLVQPISMSNANIGVGETGVFTGWGFIGYGILPRRADLLQKMDFRTISNEQCKEMYSVTHRGEYVVDQKLCILSGQRTSVCGGDSGSPLVINGALVGVTSWRTMPCGDGLPDVFIRITAARDWIYSVT